MSNTISNLRVIVSNMPKTLQIKVESGTHAANGAQVLRLEEKNKVEAFRSKVRNNDPAYLLERENFPKRELKRKNQEAQVRIFKKKR